MKHQAGGQVNSIEEIDRPDGTIYGILSILMDVTDPKSAGNEEAVRQFARKVREALDSA